LQKLTVARSGNMNSKAHSLPKSQELATELHPASGPGCHQSLSPLSFILRPRTLWSSTFKFVVDE